MKADYERKSGDSKPFEAILKENRALLPMSGGETVRFNMRPKIAGAGPTVNGVGTVVNAARALVRYTPAAPDVAIPGAYDVEWEITFPGGAVQTFPSSGFLTCLLYDDIA